MADPLAPRHCASDPKFDNFEHFAEMGRPVLEYLNYGPRGYGRIHQRPWRRRLWEFQAVVSGQLGLVLAEDSPPRFHERSLFVFPPERLHGWVNRDAEARCVITVFQFDRVPSALAELFRRRSFLVVPLDDPEIAQIEALRRLVEPRYRKPDTHSSLVFDKALVELSLLALGKAAPPQPLHGSRGRDAARVEEARHWLRDHVHENPSAAELAEAMGVSPTHLRRLFARVAGKSPSRCLREMRLEFAQDLLANTEDSVGEIAEAVGASSMAVFARAFRAATGVSPTAWRRRARRPRRIRPVGREFRRAADF